MEELSSGAQSLYEMLMVETTEEYESMFMVHKKKILAAVRVSVTDAEKQYKDYLVGNSASPPSTASPLAPSSPNSSASTSSAPPCVPSSDVSIGGFSERAAAASSSTPVAAAPQASTTTDVSTNAELDVVHDAAEDLAAPTPSTCSTVCVAGDTSSTTTPATSTAVSSLPGDLTALSVAPVAVDIKGTDLAALVPINCSSECPSHDDVVSVSVLSSPALDLLEEGASTSSLTPDTYLLEDVDISMLSENMLPPWPPPWFISFQDVIRCKDMIQVLLSDDLILGSMQLMFWAGKNPCPLPSLNMCTGIQNILQLHCQDISFMPRTTLIPLHSESVEVIRSRIRIWLCCFSSQGAQLLVFCFAACSISILQCTMDIMGISGDRHQLEEIKVVIMQLPWLSLIAAGMRPVCVQLEQLTLAKLGIMMYMIAPDATLQRYFRNGNLTVFNTAAPNCALVPYLHCKGPQATDVPIFLWFQFATQSSLGFQNEVREDSHSCERIKVVELKPPWPPSLDSVLRYLNWGNSIAKDWCSAMSFLHPSDAICEAFLGSVQHIIENHMQEYFTYAIVKLLSSSSVHVLMADPSEHDNQTKCQGSEQCLIGGILVEVIIRKEGGVLCLSGKYVKKEEKLVNICAGANQAKCWTEIRRMNQFWTRLLSDLIGGFPHEHLWDPGGLILAGWLVQQLEEIMRHATSILVGTYGQQSISIELLPGYELGHAYASAEYSVDKLGSEENQTCLPFLQPKPPWLLLMIAKLSSAAILLMIFSDNHCAADVELGLLICAQPHSSDYSQWEIAWLLVWPSGAESDFEGSGLVTITFWLYFKLESYLRTVCESIHINGIFFEFNHYEVAANHGSMTYGCLDFKNKLSAAASTLLKMQPVDDRSKFYDAFLFNWDSVPAIKYISGDPGGSFPVLDAATGVNWNSTPQPFLHLTWDPGGSTQHRLVGKPNFKKGGLSTTCLLRLTNGPPPWAVACSRARQGGQHEAYMRRRAARREGLGRNGLVAASAEAWLDA